MEPLILTPAMAEHAAWLDAGQGDIYDRLAARKDARKRGKVYVAGYERAYK